MNVKILARFSPLLALSLLVLAPGAGALPIALGPNGARVTIVKDAATFGLSGDAVVLGQVEGGRPGDADNPAGGPPETNHPAVDPGGAGTIGVAVVDHPGGGAPAIVHPPAANASLDSHAQRVAGVMVSNDAVNRGVAHAATLFSGAYVSTGMGTQDEAIVASEWVRSNNPSVINYSFLKFLDATQYPGAVAIRDGDSLLSQYVDFTATTHDILFVQAGPEDTRTIGSPWDAYNNLVVGFTQAGPSGRYDRIDPASNTNMVIPDGGVNATRNKLDLVAPGNFAAVPTIDANGDGTLGDIGVAAAAGTSFAAPLVAGIAGLLDEYATDNGLSTSAQLKKVALLNSASKHVLTRDPDMGGPLTGTAWPLTAAAITEAMPLDADLGVGQVNALAAVRQYQPGFRSDVGLQSSTAAANTSDTYNLFVGGDPLTPGSLVTATLTFDRVVTNATGNLTNVNAYASTAPPNLDLELVDHATGTVVARSSSTVDNVEHIYFNVRDEGRYDLRVRNLDGTTASAYSLAWSTGTSDGPAFSVDGGAFNIGPGVNADPRGIGASPVANPAEGLMAPFGDNPYPNDVNALGTAGPAWFQTEGEIFTSSLDGTNMQRLSGALGTVSRVGSHNAPPAAMALLDTNERGVFGLRPDDNVAGLSWGTDGTLGLPSVVLFAVDPQARGGAGTDVRFNAELSPPAGPAPTPWPDNPGGGDIPGGGEAAGDIYVTHVLDPFGAHDSKRITPADPKAHRLYVDEVKLGLQAPSADGTLLGSPEDDLDALEMDSPLQSVDPDGDGMHNAPVYFTLDRWSPSLMDFGFSPGDIFISLPPDLGLGFDLMPDQPFTFDVYADAVTNIGLEFDDAIDALILSNVADILLDPGLDEALFSLDPLSVSITALGASPADIYYTDFVRPFSPKLDWKLGGSLFASAESIGLLRTDNLNALDIAKAPEPATLALLVLALLVPGAISRRRERRPAVTPVSAPAPGA